MRVRTHECWKNHELRLRGSGIFEPCEHDLADLPTEERAELYREQCGLLGTGGLRRAAADVHEQLKLITLRVRIRVARRELGETAMITKPNNLKYLQELYTALCARLEQRKLLEQTKAGTNVTRK